MISLSALCFTLIIAGTVAYVYHYKEEEDDDEDEYINCHSVISGARSFNLESKRIEFLESRSRHRELNQNSEKKITASSMDTSNIPKGGFPDMRLLHNLNEPCILLNLESRFSTFQPCKFKFHFSSSCVLIFLS